MSIKVSVIVTVYNHAIRYFKECMESLKSQTLKECEFIIVDNNATAESKEIISEYEKLDSRFKVIHLEKNKGYGRALNIGLKEAKGEYIAFVDSDDWAEHDMYEKLYNISASNPADIIKGLFYLCEDNKEKKIGIKFPFEIYNKTLTPNEAKFYPLSMGSFWSAIYKRSMIIDNNIIFPEFPNPAAEDIIFILETYFFAKSIYFTPLVIFNKRFDNPNSTMRQKDKKAWITYNLYLHLEKFVDDKKNIIDKDLLGVKTKREFLNFYWGSQFDISKNMLKYYLAYSKLFRSNMKKGHFDSNLFTPVELKRFKNIAKHPIFTWFKEKVYLKKETNTHIKRYLFGIQYYSKRKFLNNIFSPQENYRNMLFNIIHSVWQTSGVTDELLQQLKFLSQGRYSYKTLREEIMFIYIACLLEKNNFEEAKKLLKHCRLYYEFKNLYKYIYVSDFCLKEGVFDENSKKAAFIAENFEQNLNSKVFENYLKNKKIAIVGNSGRELGKNKGAEIDSHDIVIRFGNYPSEYSKDYGIKTNIWVRAAGANSNDVINRDIKDFDFIVWNLDFKHSLVPFNLNEYLYSCAYSYPEKNIYISDYFKKSFTEVTQNDFPTTGAIFIWYLYKILGSFENINFYGFAFLDNNLEDNKHYYDNNCKICIEHHFNEEIEFLRNLCLSKKDKILF